MKLLAVCAVYSTIPFFYLRVIITDFNHLHVLTDVSRFNIVSIKIFVKTKHSQKYTEITFHTGRYKKEQNEISSFH